MRKFEHYLCFVALSVFLGAAFGQAASLEDENGTDRESRLYESSKQAWPWERVKFKCPSLNGVFSNVDDCHTFFLCVMGISSKRSCPPFTKFDKYSKKCLSSIIAICDNGDKDTTESPKETTIETKITTNKDFFACPSIFGTFAHPTDCSKYYVCALLLPSLKTCSEKELFDGVKLKCRKAKHVDCGSRFKQTSEPEDLTTLPPTNPPEPEPTTTPEPETEPTPEPTTTTSEPTTTPEPTTEEPTKPTGPPDTDCTEDDLDCIIDETGVTPAWFTCPEDIGSYPHPSSIKLFIFCLNWEPSVKKCGQDLEYSVELRTCVDP